MDPCWFHVCSYNIIFKLNYFVINSVIINEVRFCVKLAKLVCYFFIIHIRPNLRSSFCNHSPSERFQKNLCLSKLFGSRGRGIDMLTTIYVKNANFKLNQNIELMFMSVVHANYFFTINVWYMYTVWTFL